MANSADSRTALDHFPNQGNVLDGKFPATKSVIVSCSDHGVPPSPFSYSKELKQDPEENDSQQKKLSSPFHCSGAPKPGSILFLKFYSRNEP